MQEQVFVFSEQLSRVHVDQQAQKVLRNTYLLLALTLAFSALMAKIAILCHMVFLPPLLTTGVYLVLLSATTKRQNSAWGLAWIFALTGWLGFTLGPVINFYMTTRLGGQWVLLAVAGTSTTFFGLSAFSLIFNKNFTWLTQCIVTGVIITCVAAVANFFLELSSLHFAIASLLLLLSSLMIIWQTSSIIQGGETNYILATVGLYVALYNLFFALLVLFGFIDD